MGYTTLQNTPIDIDLLIAGNSRGWSIDGSDAVHETCNSGEITLLSYPITPGISYQFSYLVKSIDSGYLQARLGGATAPNDTIAGYKTVTITATTNAPLSFFSNANCRISVFDIKIATDIFVLKSKETVAWSEQINKWTSFRSYNPDCGFSLFANLFTLKDGIAYVHQLGDTRNNFYGQQYKSIFQFTSNILLGQPKTFESISYEANQLMITTEDGITTSLGQVSELVDADFLKTVLDDGVTQVNVYDEEGIYSAGFWRDKSVDIINGDCLKGSWIVIELVTTSNGALNLQNILVNSVESKIGSR